MNGQELVLGFTVMFAAALYFAWHCYRLQRQLNLANECCDIAEEQWEFWWRRSAQHGDALAIRAKSYPQPPMPAPTNSGQKSHGGTNRSIIDQPGRVK